MSLVAGIVIAICGLIYIRLKATKLRHIYLSEICARALFSERRESLKRDYLLLRQAPSMGKQTDKAWLQRIMTILQMCEPQSPRLRQAREMLLSDRFAISGGKSLTSTQGLELFALVLTQIVARELELEERKALSLVHTTLQSA